MDADLVGTPAKAARKENGKVKNSGKIMDPCNNNKNI